jgi:hypothetical protein
MSIIAYLIAIFVYVSFGIFVIQLWKDRSIWK